MDWKSSLNDVDDVTKQFKVSISVERISREYNDVMADLARTTQIKGFRAGKAPRQVVEKLHGERVKFEVANRLISTSLYDLIEKHKLEVVGSPEIDISTIDLAKDIEYTASVSVLPTPTIKGYDAFDIEVEKREVKNEDVDQTIDRMRQSKATFKKLDFRVTAQAGDVIDASLSVEIAGEEPARPEPLVVALGEGNLPEELEAGIIGMEIGTTKEISGKIPEHHREASIRGKDANFKVTLIGLSERVLPELTDDFVKSLEMEPKTLLELRGDVRKKLEEETQREQKGDTQGVILNQLLDKNSFNVPQPLVDDEIRGLLVRSGLVDTQKVDISKVSVEPFRKELGEAASKRVRTAILVDRIAEQENLTATADDLGKAMEDLVVRSGVPREEVEKYFLDKDRKGSFALETTRNKVLDFLVARAKVKLVPKKDKPEEAKKA